MTDDNYGPIEREREAADVLTKQQVNQCLMDIQDNHPLRERVKWKHILPCCAPVFKLCRAKKPNFRHAIRKTIMSEMKMKVPKSEDELMENPFLVLGYGINAYFDMMRELCNMFMTITVFFLPVFMWYKGNSANALVSDSFNPMTQLQAYTIGNMGGAQVVCHQKKLNGKKMTFECPPGLDIDYDNVIYGIMSPKLDLSYYCTEEAIHASPFNKGIHKCTYYMDAKHVHDQLMTCKDNFEQGPEKHSSCTVHFHQEADLTAHQQAIWIPTLSPPSDCTHESMFYLQTPCKIREKQLPKPTSAAKKEFSNIAKRKIYGLMVGCLGVFVYLFALIYIDYIKQVQKNKAIDFDVKTITAGDYTVEFDISHDTYDKWKNHYHKKANPMNEMAQFKLFVQTKIEERVSAMDDLGYDGPTEPGVHKHIKIAQITFAFYNEDIIKALNKRGTLIKTEKWDKVDQINDKIDDLFKKEKVLDQLQTPCSVFATFETEEGFNRACHLNEQVKDKILPKSFGKLLGKPIEVQPASEPTDIIWENRHFKPFTRTWKRVVVYFIILICLCVSGVCIYLCSSTATALKNKYPKTNCESIAKDYGIAYGKVTQEQALASRVYTLKALEKDAYREWYQQEKLEEEDRQTHFTDVLQCFCKMESKHGVHKTKMYPSPYDDQAGVETPICHFYQNDQLATKVLSIAITGVIVMFNLILKKIIIALITWVGEDTFSQRLTSITNGVFIAQFFNTGILLTLVNANLGEQLPSALAVFFQGKYFDYSQVWYQEVGTKIVQTMFINAFVLPWTGLITAKVVPWIKRKRNGGSAYKTKSTSMASFKAIWSGGEYVIHFKYSGMLNIAYVTMLYGMGMPALFPIAAVNYFNQYVAERMVVAWHMKAPATLDDQLTQSCIENLRFAPLLFLVNGAWMLGNVQMFRNVWSYIDDSSKSMQAHHFFEAHVYWATPATVFALYSIGIYIFQRIFKESLALWGFQMSKQLIKVDEDLPNFFKVIKFTSANQVIKANDNMMDNFGFERTDPDCIDVLNKCKSEIPKKLIQGTPWYQILSNPLYSDAFNYIGSFVPEREKLIEDGFPDEHVNGEKKGEMTPLCKKLRYEQSDMVMILLNISYIPDEVVQKINFKPGWSIEFKKNMDQYKREFYEKTGVKWEFQNPRLEADYIDFIHTQEILDNDVQQEKKTDEIEGRMKDFFTNVMVHRKNAAEAAAMTSGPIDMKALQNFSAKLGNKNTTIQ